jgi:putative transcriptional regulator
VSIRHHLDDDLIASYAAGSLAEGWSLAVATHLALCPDCRKRLATAEAVGGELLEAGEMDPGPDDAWAQLRDKLQTPVDVSPPTHPSGPTLVLPQPLRDYVGGDLDAIRWRALGKGASQMRLNTRHDQTQVRLLRIPAGKPVPEHAHGGRELTLVLTGAFRDGDALFGRGDIEDADAELTHQPIATPEADCICLAVTDAPLRFTSWIVRLVQPILDI